VLGSSSLRFFFSSSFREVFSKSFSASLMIIFSLFLFLFFFRQSLNGVRFGTAATWRRPSFFPLFSSERMPGFEFPSCLPPLYFRRCQGCEGSKPRSKFPPLFFSLSLSVTVRIIRILLIPSPSLLYHVRKEEKEGPPTRFFSPPS